MQGSSQEAGSGVSRRQFVTLAAAGAVGLPLLLEACGEAASTASSAPAAAGAPSRAAASTAASAAAGAPSSAPASAAAAAGGAVKLPTYIPFAGPKPDLPGAASGLDAGYYKFPANLIQSVPKPPGDGSVVTSVSYLTLAAPPPMDQNTAWQAVNKAVGATINMNMISAADYNLRLSTVLAGADLPDFIYNPTTTSPTGIIAGLPAFAQSKCADLTPYLSGDAIKDYPNLGHYTTYTWKSGVIANKIYALPIARAPIGGVMMYRADMFEKAGIKIDGAPKNADELKKMLGAVTDAKNNVWGVATNQYFALSSNSAFLGIFNAPNNWKLDSAGKLVKDFETEEYKAAIAWCADVWKAGYWHPNSPTYGASYNDDFMAGKFAFAPGGVWGQYVQLWDIQPTRQATGKLYPMLPFAADGGKPSYPAGSGNFGFTLIRKQTSEARLKMLLGIANFFAAPFGTTEWLLNYYGVKDIDYTTNAEGAPVFTDKGRSELAAVWRYISSPAYAMFDPVRSQEFADISHKAEEAMLANLVFDPTLGLYSETSFTGGFAAQNTVYAAAADIVQGRRPISDWTSVVADWKSKAGEKIRGEFQAALDASKK